MDRRADTPRGLSAWAIAVLVLGWSGSAWPEGRLYTTWAPWQADSVVAAWTLKRYVDPGAQFEAVASGTRLPADRALDTPDSAYRRSGARTAFEEVVRVHKLEFACLERLRPIIRVLELARWRKSESPQAESFESALNQRLPREPGRGGLESAFAYVDSFCATAPDTK
jgi:hypothetical protein